MAAPPRKARRAQRRRWIPLLLIQGGLMAVGSYVSAKAYAGLAVVGIIVLLALLLLRWFSFARRLRGALVIDGRYCARCEYDLTGNVSGTCPECGSHFGKPTRQMRYRM